MHVWGHINACVWGDACQYMCVCEGDVCGRYEDKLGWHCPCHRLVDVIICPASVVKLSGFYLLFHQ